MDRTALYAAAAGCELTSTATALYGIFVASCALDDPTPFTYDELRYKLGNRNRPGMAGRQTLTDAIELLLSRGLITQEPYREDAGTYEYNVTPSSERPLAPAVGDALTRLLLGREVGAAAKHVALRLALATGPDGSVRWHGRAPSKGDLQAMTGLDRRPAFAALIPLAETGYLLPVTTYRATLPNEPDRFGLRIAVSDAPRAAAAAIPAVARTEPSPAPPAPVSEPLVEAAALTCRVSLTTVTEIVRELIADGCHFEGRDGERIFAAAAEAEQHAEMLGADPSVLKNWLGKASGALRRDGAGGWEGYLRKCVKNHERDLTAEKKLALAETRSAGLDLDAVFAREFAG